MLGAISRSVFADYSGETVGGSEAVGRRAGVSDTGTEPFVRSAVNVISWLFGKRNNQKNYKIPSSVLAAEEAERVARATLRASKAVSAVSVNAKANASVKNSSASVSSESSQSIRKLPTNKDGVVLKEKTDLYEIYKVI